MEGENNSKNHIKYFIIFGILFVIILLIYVYILHCFFMENNFFNSCLKIYEANENPIFRLKKVVFYSSADVVNDSNDSDLQNLDISQFSDIAVFIDNTSYLTDLTEKNTVKELYIDDFSIEIDPKYDDISFDYKNPQDFGKFHELAKNIKDSDRINFNIVYNNTQNQEADYSTPTFYTDCSNPISLGLNNNNVITGFSLDENNSMSFNGSIFKQANIDINSLNYKLNFTIHIKNNANEKFSYNLTIDIPMDKIGKGYLFKQKNCSKKKSQYVFFKEPI